MYDHVLRFEELYQLERNARGSQDVNLAHRYLDEMETLVSKFADSEYPAQRSQLAYEKGMVFFLENELTASAEKLKESAEWAKQSKDQIKYFSCQYRYIIGLDLIDNYPTSEVVKELIGLFNERSNVMDLEEDDLYDFEENGYNVLRQICDLSFEIQASDFPKWVHLLLEHEYMNENELNTVDRYELIKWQMISRLKMRNESFDESAAIFATFLDVDIEELEPVENINALDEVKNFALNSAGVIARDYRDLGRALLKTSIPNKKELAAKVWKRGTEFGDTRGNAKYQKQIAKDLGSIG